MNIDFFYHHKGDWVTRDDIIEEIGREKFGKDPKQTLQFYEKKGLIPRAVRKRGRKGGVYSCYKPEVIQTLIHIKNLQNEGYLLDEIKELLKLKKLRAIMPDELVGTSLMVTPNRSKETKEPDIIELSNEQIAHFVKADGTFNYFIYDLIKKKYAESLIEKLSNKDSMLASSNNDASK